MSSTLHRATWTSHGRGKISEHEGWVVGFVSRADHLGIAAVVILPDDTYTEVPINELKFKRWDFES